jgi:hypothetical protein
LDHHQRIWLLSHTTRQKTGCKNHKNLYINHYAAHPKNLTFLRNIKIVFFPANCISQLQHLDLGIIHAFNCHYRTRLARKTSASIEGGMLQDTVQMDLNVFSAWYFITEEWRLITPTTIKNRFMSCGLSIHHVTNNDSNVMNWKWTGLLAWFITSWSIFCGQYKVWQHWQYSWGLCLEVCKVQSGDHV